MNLTILRTPIARVPKALGDCATEPELVTFLRAHGPCTVRSIQARMKLTGSAAGARMAKLEAEGKVIRSGVERGPRGGSPAIVWRAAA